MQRAFNTDSIVFLCPFTVNAADNKQRDKSMTCIKVNIDVWVQYHCTAS